MAWKGDGSNSNSGKSGRVAPDPSVEGKSGDEEEAKHPTGAWLSNLNEAFSLGGWGVIVRSVFLILLYHAYALAQHHTIAPNLQ